jgi:hypothetical protein
MAVGLWALAAALGCSVFEPDVGPLQNDGAAPSTCSLGTSGYGTTYGAPSGQAATVDFCTVDGGTIQGACDSCEAASCCAQRVACYSDQACSCADQTLDACLGSLPPSPVPAGDGGSDGGTSDAGAAAGACWAMFAATGAAGQLRYACLRSACAQACQIPD